MQRHDDDRRGRRAFLGCAAGAALGLVSARASSGLGPPPAPVPRVRQAINVQPLRRFGSDPDPAHPLIEPELVALQLREVYALGFDGLRITVPFIGRGDFLAAIPYVRAARALGIDVLVILSDFTGFGIARALHDERRRAAVLRLYDDVFAGPLATAAEVVPKTGRIAFQILNEPAHFLGLPPDVYVREILRPCFDVLKPRNPELIVVSAAEVGSSEGPPRMRVMLEAGLEFACDRIGYHIYSRKLVPLLADDVKKLVWVTESGADGTANHLPWVRDVFPEILSTIGDATRVFYFDLYDPEPGRFRLIDIQPDTRAGYRRVIESAELYAFFQQTARLAQTRPTYATFDELVPDIGAYFPTAADVRALDLALSA
jgi:hypothetical protein